MFSQSMSSASSEILSASSVIGEGQYDQPSRTLRHFQLAPSVLLNPMGAAPLSDVSLEDYWRLLKAGNESAESFCELCFNDIARQQVGLSRFAEVLEKTLYYIIEQEQFLRATLKEEFVDRLMFSVKKLEPHIKKMNLGAGGQVRSVDALRSLSYMQRSSGRPEGIEESAKEVWQWIHREEDALQQYIALFGAGGIYYNAEVFLATVQVSFL